jgi:hypothetical protein
MGEAMKRQKIQVLKNELLSNTRSILPKFILLLPSKFMVPPPVPVVSGPHSFLFQLAMIPYLIESTLENDDPEIQYSLLETLLHIMTFANKMKEEHIDEFQAIKSSLEKTSDFCVRKLLELIGNKVKTTNPFTSAFAAILTLFLCCFTDLGDGSLSKSVGSGLLCHSDVGRSQISARHCPHDFHIHESGVSSEGSTWCQTGIEIAADPVQRHRQFSNPR